MTFGLVPLAVFRKRLKRIKCGLPTFTPSGMRMSFVPRFSKVTQSSRQLGLLNETEILRPLLAGPHSTGAATAASTDMSTVDASSQKRPIPGLDTISIRVVPTATSGHSGHRLPGSTLNVKSADLKFSPFHLSV